MFDDFDTQIQVDELASINMAPQSSGQDARLSIWNRWVQIPPGSGKYIATSTRYFLGNANAIINKLNKEELFNYGIHLSNY